MEAAHATSTYVPITARTAGAAAAIVKYQFVTFAAHSELMLIS